MQRCAKPGVLQLIPLALFFIFGGTGPPLESVPDELARLQKQTGLSLILIDDIVQVFIPRGHIGAKEIKLPEGGTGGEISADGTEVAFILSRGTGSHVAISRIDGTDLKEYRTAIEPQEMCWSHDKSMLALRALSLQNVNDLESTLAAYEHRPTLQILDLHSGKMREISERGSVTSECWSPDDKQLVYESSGDIRVYDVVTKRCQVLSSGQYPTWSPEGTKISFMRDDGYYSVSPSGAEERRLFKKFHPQSGLLWSPDSRFVVYVSQSRFFECGFALDVETYCLRIRRMADNAEWRVSPSNQQCACQWVVNKALLQLPNTVAPLGRVFMADVTDKRPLCFLCC